MAKYFSLYLIFILLVSILPIHSLFCQYKEVTLEQNVLAQFGQGNLGGGISFSDFNNDGWDDLTIATEKGEPMKFYVNNFGTFQEITPLVSDLSEVKSVIWVDLDNDGKKDLFLTCHEDQNRIYKNIGSLQLIDVTSNSGLTMINDPSFGASFGDLNLDGLLDLYTTSYYDGVFINRLFLNLGNFQFQDITNTAGVYQAPNLSFQPHFLDYNNDMLPDIYVAIDKAFNNLLFKNNGNSTFTEVGAVNGAGIIICAMNSSSGDIDNDGDLDIYVTNNVPGNVLLKNNGNGTYTDITASAGVGFYRVGWGTNFIDVENDGDLDMYVSAMSISEPNALYINNGNNVFSEPLYATNGLGGTDLYPSLCNARGDFNNDGKQDLAVSNENFTPVQLWENDSNAGNWFKIDLEGQISNKGGIGSWVSIHSGTKAFYRYTYCGEAYLAQNSDYIHFGLDNITVIDSLIVKWPSGVIDKYYNLDVNQFLPIVENTSSNIPNPCPIIKDVQFLPNDITTSHTAEQLIRIGGTLSQGINLELKTGKLVVMPMPLNIPSSASITVINDPCINN